MHPFLSLWAVDWLPSLSRAPSKREMGPWPQTPLRLWVEFSSAGLTSLVQEPYWESD